MKLLNYTFHQFNQRGLVSMGNLKSTYRHWVDDQAVLLKVSTCKDL